jgi:hypothetical protein
MEEKQQQKTFMQSNEIVQKLRIKTNDTMIMNTQKQPLCGESSNILILVFEPTFLYLETGHNVLRRNPSLYLYFGLFCKYLMIF